MRRLLYTVFFSGLSACCTKVGCPPSDRIEVAVNGLDTTAPVGVRVYSYARNTSFSSAKDTFFTQVYLSAYSQRHRFVLPETMTRNDDLRILLDSPAKVFEVTDFIMQRSVCNQCWGTSDEYRIDPKSYLLNGQRIESRVVEIHK